MRVKEARIVKAHRRSLLAERDAVQAGQAAAKARAELAQSIADAAPLLTAEQREALRPLLAGTLDQAGAAESAA